MSVKRAVAPPDDKKNLILVADKRFDWRDLEEIAREVVKQAPDVAVHLVSTRDTSEAFAEEKWSRPTLTVGFQKLGRFLPPQRPHSRQPADLQARSICGLQCRRNSPRRAPRGSSLARTMTRRNGANLSSSSRCRFRSDEQGRQYPVDPHPQSRKPCRRNGFRPIMPCQRVRRSIQQYVDTGDFATNWRVLTLFGEPLYCFKSRSPIARPISGGRRSLIEAAIVEPKHPRVKSEFNYSDYRSFETTIRRSSNSRARSTAPFPPSRSRAATSCSD